MGRFATTASDRVALVLGSIALALFPSCNGTVPASGDRASPRLAVIVIVDGLGQERLERSLGRLPPGGFRRFFDDGAWFSRAEHAHALTMTSSGHATLLTGSDPVVHGVLSNYSFDRESGRKRYMVADPVEQVLGDEVPGVSPRTLDVPTLGDLLSDGTGSASKVYAVAGKDRSAVLSAGRQGVAFWFRSDSGGFVSSTYYLADYPEWWLAFHDDLSALYPDAPEDAREVLWSGRVDEWTTQFARRVVEGEGLGNNPEGAVDLLVVGLSGLDYVHHLHGPDGEDSERQIRRIDAAMRELFKMLDERVGPGHWVAALSADHGFPPSPMLVAKSGTDAGCVRPHEVKTVLARELRQRFGLAGLLAESSPPQVWLDRSRAERAGVDPARVEAAAAEALSAIEGIERVITRSELMSDRSDALLDRVRRSWRADRGSDLVIVPRPGWCFLSCTNETASTHGSPHGYDTQVPLAFFGSGIVPGRVDEPAETVDLMPTLATVLDLPVPDHVRGVVRDEVVSAR